MSIKKLFVGVAVVALLLGVSFTSVKAQTVADLNALIAQLQAQISALQGNSPAIGGYSFTNNLTVGSQGADVSALQEILINAGHLSIAAPTGYFGALTKAAVMAWQREVGITPVSGYVGPISRGALNSMGSVITDPFGSNPFGPGPVTSGGPCSGGAMYNSVTGALCSMPLPAGCTSTSGFSPVTGMSCMGSTGPVVYPAGCTSSTGYSVTTGMSCATVTPGTTPGGATEGSITADLAASPAANANIRTQTDVPVWGVDIKAVNSDMTMDRLDLQVSVTPVGGSAENPGIFIRNIKVWDGSTLLKEVAVDSSTFTKDSSDRYHIIVSGIGFKVVKGAERPVTVSFTVASISSTDVNRTVAVQGYAGNTQNVRATDTVGLQSYADMSGSANTRSHTFKPAGASTLTVSTNSALNKSLASSNSYKLSSTNGVTKKIMQAFDAKAETGNAKITKLYIGTNATSSAGVPTTYYLCNGSDTTCASPLASVGAGATDNLEVAFTSLDIMVNQDTTKTFLIAADFPTTVGGQAASSSIHTNAVQWEKPDGSTASTTPASEFAGKDQYFFDSAPQWTLVSQSMKAVPGVVSVASSSVQGTITLKAKALGGAMTKPVIGDFTLVFASSTQANGAYTTDTASSQNALTASSTGITISPSDATVGEDGEYTVTLTGSAFSNIAGTLTAGESQSLFMAVKNIDSVTGTVTITNQTWGLDDFFTDRAVLTKGTL